jgi:multisubunit Na+/H+ antiporter MnhG subunit
MKTTDKLKPTEKAMVCVIISVVLMLISILTLSFNLVFIEELVSFKTALLIAPFILFAISMVVYDILWEKEHLR